MTFQYFPIQMLREAEAALQTSLPLMKNLNKTEPPIFYL